jgi:hypothetical protein
MPPRLGRVWIPGTLHRVDSRGGQRDLGSINPISSLVSGAGRRTEVAAVVEVVVRRRYPIVA